MRFLISIRRRPVVIEGLFVQVLALAREIGMLKPGTVALDGTKIHANASRGKIQMFAPDTATQSRMAGRALARIVDQSLGMGNP